jgi:hypothetical protein
MREVTRMHQHEVKERRRHVRGVREAVMIERHAVRALRKLEIPMRKLSRRERNVDLRRA